MSNVIETLSDVFALANNATELVKTLIESTKGKENKLHKDRAQIGSSGYAAKIGSSGDAAKIGSSGDVAQIGSSGYAAQIGSSGYAARIGSSGDVARIGSSGYVARIGSSGYVAQIGSSGYAAQIGSSGYAAKIGSSGDAARIGSSGYAAKIGSSGDAAQIGSSGDVAKIGSSGDAAKIDSTGNKSVISAIGAFSAVKASKGSWITLAEYKFVKNRYEVDFVKTEYVDGKKIKDGQFYCLYNHKFHEYAEFDGIKCAILSKKGNVYKTVSFDNFNDGKITYVIEKDGVYSHGETIKDAKESFIYKISNRDTSAYENYTKDTIVSFKEAIKMYRTITGACEAGTKYFVKSLNEVKKEYSIAEIIEITQGQYGYEEFKDFFERKSDD